MISIITAIFNQLDMNRLYYESLSKSTDGEFELIIIDNGSDDGSVEFFSNLPNVKVIKNPANYSYPYCQNIGIKAAKGDILAFFNNDIILSPHWDTRIKNLIGKNNCEVLSLASNDRMGDKNATKKLSRRWKRIKYPIITTLGQKKFALKLMITLCYGKWDKFCEKIHQKYQNKLIPGFSGSAIIMTRKALKLIGEWDPTQQAADFDIFYRTMQRHEQKGDISPLKTAAGIFHHHFRRLTLRCDYPPFADADHLIPLEQKWSSSDRIRYNRLLSQP